MTDDIKMFDFHAFMQVLLTSGNFGKSKYTTLINLVDMLTNSEVLLDAGEYEYEQSFLLKIHNGREKLPKQVIATMQGAIDEQHIIESLKDYLSEDVYEDVLVRLYDFIESDPYLEEKNAKDREKLLLARDELLADEPGKLIFNIYRYVILNEISIRDYQRQYNKKIKVSKVNDELIDSIDSMIRSQLDFSSVKALLGRSHQNMSSPSASSIIRILGESDRWQLMSNMYSNMVKIRQYEGKEKQTNAEYMEDENIFKIIMSLTDQSQMTFPLNISGEYKSGKTVFFLALYYYILDQYQKNNIDYFPIYLDVSVFFNENKKNKQIKTILKKAYKLSFKLNSRIIVLLDGISSVTNNDYDNQNRIKANIEHLISKTDRERDKKIKVINAINTNTDLSFSIGNSRKTWPLHARNVIYINSVSLLNVYEDQKNKVGRFAESFIKFREISSPELFYENLKKVDLDRITLNFFLRFEEDLSSDKDSVDVVSLYDDYLSGNPDFTSGYEQAPEIAFDIYYSGRNYAELTKQYGTEFSYKAYDIIRQREMLFYMIAKHYLNTIIKIIDNDDIENMTIPEESIGVINRLYNKNITSLMLNIIINNGNEYSEKIFGFIKKYYNSVDMTGLISLSYLLGRIKKDRDSCLNLLTEILEYVEHSGSHKNKELAIRSLELSIIHKTAEQNKEEQVQQYTEELIGSERKRFINRSFQRLYYGDVQVNDGFDIDTDIYDKATGSLDFYNTFQSLVHRLNIRIKDSTEKYPLKRIDLFTLCDLLNSRSRDMYIIDDENTEPTYFFGSSKHREETLAIIDKLIIEYFLIENKPLVLDSSDILFDGNSFESFLRETHKHINHLKTYDKNNSTKIDIVNGPGSNIGSAYHLALFNLPKNISDFRSYNNWSSSLKDSYSSYNKDSILRMIQIKETLGCEDDLVEAQNVETRLMSGIIQGTADLLDYFNLWKEYHNGNSINAQIAGDFLTAYKLLADKDFSDTKVLKTDIGRYIFFR